MALSSFCHVSTSIPTRRGDILLCGRTRNDDNAPAVTSFAVRKFTFHKRGGKPGLLHGAVRQELDVQLVRGRMHVQRQLVTAILVYQRAVGRVSVPDLHVIVEAIVMVFDLRNNNSNNTLGKNML